MEEIMPMRTLSSNIINNTIVLEFNNLVYTVRNSTEKRQTHILSNVSGCFKPGKLYGILGPSGAGKTSLLNVLSGFKKTNTIGSITVNGQQLNRNEFRSNSAYITQEFVMLPKLTVHETIQLSASFKLASKYTNQMKNNIIKEIMEVLNLRKCAKTLVEQLSGGEKKRLSIAVELVTLPPIMFFDEPTSGLDSVAAYQIMLCLKNLTLSNHTIICTIHQPSSKIIDLFNDLYVLSNGKCIYNGPLNDMITTFANAGFECPNYYNRADFAIEVASLDRGTNIEALVLQANSVGLYPVLYNEPIYSKSGDIQIQNVGIDQLAGNCCGYPTSFCSQFYYLLKRQFLSSRRDFMYTQLRIICHILIGTIIGTVFYDIGNDASKVLTNLSCIFFALLFLFFGNSMPTILSVPTEIEVFMREYRNNWYSIPAYYLSKILSDLPLQILLPLIFIKIIFYMSGQPTDEEFRFYYCYLICFLITIIAYLFGLTLGTILSVKHGIFAIPAINIPILLFSGFFIHYNELSVFLQPVMYISYFRNAYVGSILAIYDYHRAKLECAAAYCHYKSPKSILIQFDVQDEDYWSNISGLCVWLVSLLIIFFMALIVRVKFH